MVECAQRAGFLLETGAAGWVLGQFAGQHFDGDHAVEAFVAGAPDFAHAAFAQLVADFVVAEFLASHIKIVAFGDRAPPRKMWGRPSA